MTTNNTIDGAIIEIEPFDLRNVIGSLTAADTFIAAADGAMQELANLLASNTEPPPIFVISEIVQSAIGLMLDGRTRIVEVKSGLEANGGVS